MKKSKLSIIKKMTAIVLASSMLFSLASCSKDKDEPQPDNSKTGPTTSVKGKVSYEEMMKKLAAAKEVNELAAAYIEIPGTNIDYPVILDSSERNQTNEYWLDRNLQGEVTNSNYWTWQETALYLDVDTKLPTEETGGLPGASSNFVIFGHNWNNIRTEPVIGNDPEYKMFAQLPSFMDEDFASANPYIYFSTPDAEMVFKIFSIMYTEEDWTKSAGKDYNYISTNLNAFQQEDMVNEVKDRSLMDYDVDVNGDDKLITLSTCTRAYQGAGGQQRYVVVGRLLREGETDDEKTVEVHEHVTAEPPKF